MSSPRTMKQPPGGDCHDLFGAEFKGSPCHHRVLKPPGGGTSDIFGRPEAVEQSPRRSRPVNHLQSSLFAETNGTTTEPPSTPRNKPDSNPVTGEAYTNGEKETSSSPPPAPATTNGSDSAQARRGRVPPGGFSSGLW